MAEWNPPRFLDPLTRWGARAHRYTGLAWHVRFAVLHLAAFLMRMHRLAWRAGLLR